MSYEAWRATFQSSEQAARAAYQELQAARAQGCEKPPQVMGRVYRDVYGKEGEPVPHLNSEGRKLPDGAALYAEPVAAQRGEVEHASIEIADDTPEWIKKYLRETEFETVEALRAAYHALMNFKSGSPDADQGGEVER